MHIFLRILIFTSLFFYLSCQYKSVLKGLDFINDKSPPYILNRLALRRVLHFFDPFKYAIPSMRVIENSHDQDLRIVEIINPLANLVTDEYIYAKAELIQSVGFFYDQNNRIIYAVICDQENKPILEQRYIYTGEGDLWEIIEDEGMTLYADSIAYTQRRLQSLTEDKYDAGFLSSTKNYALSDLVEEQDYVYSDGYLLQKISKNYLENTEIFTRYDKNQRPIEQSYFSQGDFLETQTYKYNDEGLVSQKTIESTEGTINREVFSYGDQKQLSTRAVYVGGLLHYLQTYNSPEDYTIDYYAFGAVRLREVYEKNELVEKKVLQKEEKVLVADEYDDDWEGYEEF